MPPPIPGPPRVDLTITYGSDLAYPILRRDKATKTERPYAAGSTAFVRLGGKTRKGDPIPCEVDGAVIHMHLESTVLDTLGPETEYQLLVEEPGAAATPAGVLVGSLIHDLR